ILSGGLLKHNQEAVGLHLDLALKRITLQDEKLQSQGCQLKFQETEMKIQAIQISKIMEKLNEIEKKPEVNSPFTDHLIWKINQFSDEKQKAKNDCDYTLTKCFYTSRGHKLEIVLYPIGDNGSRRNKNMAIYAQTVQGSFDDTINWPMEAIIEFYALDRSGNRRSYISFNTNQTAYVTSFVKPPHTANGYGIDHFVSLSNGNPYRNDTFTVEVMIKYKEN
uniref:MATH domain-containing protein n=2 Tax=Clytia hemisphaerica TaxID=252671 RepID=A0A7M5X5K3_9CNID